MTSNETTVNGLPKRLPDEACLDRANLDQVKDCPKWSRILETLRGLYVALD